MSKHLKLSPRCLIIQNNVEIFLLHIPPSLPTLTTHLQSCNLQSKKPQVSAPFNDWKLSFRRLTSLRQISLVIGGDSGALFMLQSSPVITGLTLTDLIDETPSRPNCQAWHHNCFTKQIRIIFVWKMKYFPKINQWLQKFRAWLKSMTINLSNLV